MSRCKATPTRRGNENSRKSSKKVSKPNHQQRFRPATTALRDFRLYQQATKLEIAKLSFKRFVLELSHEWNTMLKYEASAIKILHYASEEYLVEIMENAYRCAQHSNRITLKLEDIQLATRIRLEQA
ncbi:unnamed protein product [Caenorhabditis brenneri]